MKTILEFGEEMMEKKAYTVGQLPALMAIPTIAGAAGGKLYSDFTAPPARRHETFQADLLKERLKNMLIERKKQQKIEKLEEVLSGTQRSIRI